MFLLVIRVVLLPINTYVLTCKNSIGLMQLCRSIYCMVEGATTYLLRSVQTCNVTLSCTNEEGMQEL